MRALLSSAEADCREVRGSAKELVSGIWFEIAYDWNAVVWLTLGMELGWKKELIMDNAADADCSEFPVQSFNHQDLPNCRTCCPKNMKSATIS